jgi:isoleucyl-tRNA synthetase
MESFSDNPSPIPLQLAHHPRPDDIHAGPDCLRNQGYRRQKRRSVFCLTTYEASESRAGRSMHKVARSSVHGCSPLSPAWTEFIYQTLRKFISEYGVTIFEFPRTDVS